MSPVYFQASNRIFRIFSYEVLSLPDFINKIVFRYRIEKLGS